MRIYHFTIFFAVFVILMIIIRDLDIKEKSFESGERIRREKAVQQAVEQAAWKLRVGEAGIDNETEMQAIDAFFYSACASMGIMDAPASRSSLMREFPSLIISFEDGYYLYRYEWNENGSRWSDHYIKSDEKYAYDGNLPQSGIGFSVVDKKLYSAGVADRKKYIVDKDGLYHEEHCLHQGEMLYILYSKQGCSMLGAKACMDCIDR